MMIEFDTQEYIEMLLEIAEEGREVSLKVVGNSMAPFLCNGRDYVFFSALKNEPGIGDIVLFRRKNGSYILHRVCRITGEGYFMVGDNQNTCDVEGPVLPDQICAVIEKVQRKNVILMKTNFWWWFFHTVWIRVIPMRKWMKRFASWLY